jgi:hypothetical protein
MTNRDQIEFKIRKITRAIDALADVPHYYPETRKMLKVMRNDRAELRRTIADDLTTARLARMGASGYHVCDDLCSESGKMIFE